MIHNDNQQTSQLAFLGKLAITVFLATAALFVVSLRDYAEKPYEEQPVSVVYSWFPSGVEATSQLLVSGNAPWERLPSDGIMVSDSFAYVRLELRNQSQTDREVILYNNVRNYRTSLLKPLEQGAVLLARHGDNVPISESPLRHYKASFPVIVPADSQSVYILEYYGVRGIKIDLDVLGIDLWLSQHLYERSLMSFAVGGLIILILLNLILSILVGNRYFFSTALFLFTLCFFYMRQSRLLMLVIDPLTYADWLYPVSISINCLGALYFFRSLIPADYSGWEKKAIEVLMGVSVILGIISLFYKPYDVGDILNAFSVLILPLLFYYTAKAAFRQDYMPLMVVLSFIPWIILMVIDVIKAQFTQRQTNSEDFKLWVGLLTSLVLLLVTRLYTYARFVSPDVPVVVAPDPAAAATVRQSMIQENCNERFFYRFHQPLDSIIASARIMEKEYADPGIMAVAQIIIGEAETIKHVGRTMLQVPVLQELFDHEAFSYGSHAGATSPVVRIFDFDKQQAARMANMLCADSFDAEPEIDRYRLLADIADGRVDVLVIDAATCGEAGFTLCRLIRDKHSMFQFPILLIADYYEQTMLKRGYAVGVNDFLTRPYDGTELTARIRSLLRLREIDRMNRDLEQSEKEKNAFLYFLTHNVNTPLTVLMNLVRELSAAPSNTKEAAKIGEMEDCVQEINDIVQNVLISFRLTDGRQTLWLEPVELSEELERTVREISKRADQKRQSISVSKPGNVPRILADRTSVRGILYNLIDNAVKFTPSGGAVTISVSGEHDVRVTVCDTGPGIPAEERTRLFQRFERLSTRPTGGEASTGLGLHVSRELAVMNGGSLEYGADSPGACFVLTLKRYYGGEV